jgi:hypothetical protein
MLSFSHDGFRREHFLNDFLDTSSAQVAFSKKGNYQVNGSMISLEAGGGSLINFLSCYSLPLYSQRLDGQQIALSPIAMALTQKLFPLLSFLPMKTDRSIAFGSIDAKLQDSGFAPGSSMLQLETKSDVFLFASKISGVSSSFAAELSTTNVRGLYLRIPDGYEPNLDSYTSLSLLPKRLKTYLSQPTSRESSPCIVMATEGFGELLAICSVLLPHFSVSCEKETLSTLKFLAQQPSVPTPLAEKLKKLVHSLLEVSQPAQIHLFPKQLLLNCAPSPQPHQTFLWFGTDFLAWNHLATTRSCPWKILSGFSWGCSTVDYQEIIAKTNCEQIVLLGNPSESWERLFRQLKVPFSWLKGAPTLGLF